MAAGFMEKDSKKRYLELYEKGTFGRLKQTPLHSLVELITLLMFGAEAGTRTPTGILPLDPEPSASTNSATSAYLYTKNYIEIQELIQPETYIT